MKEKSQLSPLGAEMVAGMAAFCDALEAGEAIEKSFTVRTVTLNLEVRSYKGEDIKHVRRTLRVSQALLAQFLGVSASAVRAWEQGTRPVPRIACRFLDEIVANPDLWKRRISASSHVSQKVNGEDCELAAPSTA